MQYVNYDMRRSPLTDSLARAAFLANDTDSFFSLTDVFVPSSPFGPSPPLPNPTYPPSASEVLADGIDNPNNMVYQYTRGGVAGNYTARFEMDCREYLGNMTLLPQLRKGWLPRNMAIVSNGLCGSTCSNIVR